MSPADVEALYERYKRSSVDRTIAPGDAMWIGASQWYFPVGESALLAILRALTAGSLTSVKTVLDLPCGHGRVARHLRAAFPETRLTFCDLDRASVDFCTKTFGGHGVYSRRDLAQVSLPGPFDVIWVGSLFTHVDERRTEKWMDFLCRQLADNGVLVATFHGRRSLEIQRTRPLIDDARWREILQGYERTGYGYADYPVSFRGSTRLLRLADRIPAGRHLAYRISRLVGRTRGYGISLSKPQKIVELASRIPGVRVLAYTEQGWADNHDVLVVARTGRPSTT